MQHRSMADDNAFLDVERTVKVGVDDTTILEVDARTKGDARQVAAQDCAVPEIDARREDNIARDHYARRDVVIVDAVHGISLFWVYGVRWPATALDGLSLFLQRLKPSKAVPGHRILKGTSSGQTGMDPF